MECFYLCDWLFCAKIKWRLLIGRLPKEIFPKEKLKSSGIKYKFEKIYSVPTRVDEVGGRREVLELWLGGGLIVFRLRFCCMTKMKFCYWYIILDKKPQLTINEVSVKNDISCLNWKTVLNLPPLVLFCLKSPSEK